jgi:hypothetical protein
MKGLKASILSFEQGSLKTGDLLFRVSSKSMNVLTLAGSFFPAV